MTRFCTLLILFFSVLQVNAQQRYYVFIQTENPAAFYIKKDNKVQNSSTGGYLIISNLLNGKHDFSIGFSNSTYPEQHFSIDLKGKDKSYLLKNFESKGWGLIDLQDLSITHAVKAEPGFKLKPTDEVSPFTNVLIQASGDSTLKYTAVVSTTKVPAVTQNTESNKVTQPVGKVDQPSNNSIETTKTVNTISTNQDAENSKEVQKPQTIETSHDKQKEVLNIQKNDTLTTETLQKVDEPSGKIISKVKSAKNPETFNEYQHSKILKVSESSTTEGLGIIYRDISPDGKEDTVRIIISDTEEKPKQVVASQAKPSKERKFLDISTAKDTSVSIKTESSKEAQSKKEIQPVDSEEKQLVNNCSEKVSDKELARLRSKMALAVTDETMIVEAKMVFSEKCMTSSQVKRLSELFVTNAGKYSFFKAVYPFVSDKQYFYTLRSELTDDHYNSRFVDIMQTR